MDAANLIDPQSNWIRIGDNSVVPSNQDGWRALGECIGSHGHLQELEFWNVNSTREDLEALLIGVNQNRSVSWLKFYYCDDEWPLGILATFFQRNQNLSTLDVMNCDGSIFSSLSSALRGCTSRSLGRIACEELETGDEVAAEFIEALAGLPQLRKLELIRCDIMRRGCGAVAALLRSPACMLQEINIDDSGIGDEGLALLGPAVAASSTLEDLSLCDIECTAAALHSFFGILRSPTCMLKTLSLNGNNIGDDELVSFADALATNRRLEGLVLDDWHSISDFGFAAVTRVLCDISSIGNVHSSNHTLQHLVYDDSLYEYFDLKGMPDVLLNYLHMNEGEDKSLVARRKILMHFFKGNFSMEPFHENAMAPNILPHLLGWIGRTPDEKSFTALFSFLRRMPPTLGNRRSVLRRSRRKRKVRD